MPFRTTSTAARAARCAAVSGLAAVGLLASCGAPAEPPPGPDSRDAPSAPVTLRVSAKATGAFGSLLGGIGDEPDPSLLHMVEAVSLEPGERVTVSATGQIHLAEGRETGPDGMTPEEAPDARTVFPLQERDADNGLATAPEGNPGRLGALMGACVPVTNPATFVPLNDDPDPDTSLELFTMPDPVPVGHIPAAALFYIGSGPFELTADDACVLFLGVNDAFAPNNDGAFDVTVSRPAAP